MSPMEKVDRARKFAAQLEQLEHDPFVLRSLVADALRDLADVCESLLVQEQADRGIADTPAVAPRTVMPVESQ